MFADTDAVVGAFVAWLREAPGRRRSSSPMSATGRHGGPGPPRTANGTRSSRYAPRRRAAPAQPDGAGADAHRPDRRRGPRGDDAGDRRPRGPARASRSRLATAGRHNAANALAVAGAAPSGRPRHRTSSLRGLATFQGVGRRLERKGEAGGVVVYDDYAHHPTAIRETLARHPPARARPARVGRLRAAHVPPHGGAAR